MAYVEKLLPIRFVHFTRELDSKILAGCIGSVKTNLDVIIVFTIRPTYAH